MTTKPLTGIIPALTTPFENDQVSTGKLAFNIALYNRSELSGYLVCGSTGECVLLSDDESAAVVKTAREAAGPEKILIAGTARESLRATVEATRRAADLGADFALIRPPSYYKSRMDRETLRTFFLKTADDSPVPVIVYNIPQNTGFSLEAELIVELSDHDNIAGLKESSGNLTLLAAVVRRLPQDFSYLLGAGSVVVPALQMGASGAILAVADAVPEVCADMYRLFVQGDFEGARKRQLDIVPLNRLATEARGIPGLKAALDMRGFYGGPVRLPLLPATDKDRAEIDVLLKSLGL
ncbi:MAG: dihydrodipicolinate synthase family protein [Acidobacteriota bacterium]|nr:dihydrodipicolinate synthase family protein [Acidobacteriota bacterium]